MSNNRNSFFPINKENGFTLMEAMIVLTLFMLLSMGILATITTLQRISHSQAIYNSVLALVMQEQETLRSIDYNPPNAPFTSFSNTVTTNKSVSTPNKDGTTRAVDVTLNTTYLPTIGGHLVTIVADYTLTGRTISIRSETLVNSFSFAQ